MLPFLNGLKLGNFLNLGFTQKEVLPFPVRHRLQIRTSLGKTFHFTQD
jgi:hypothetical protein